ncbi:MAG TPA: rRNA maturation RNase YbeY [Verrucomicrobiae bacterium]|jgi:probable rRNA maturation factor|nr:rRNA maturation RNase YbeY [Verrucomicrobiae bacterium]
MRLVRLFVRQRAVKLERTLWRRVAQCLLEELLKRRGYELGVHFIGATEMARMNETFLAHEGSTDVLTFNHHESSDGERLYGEIFICVDDALVHARRFRVRWQWELARYLVHGVLHLEGCDDRDPASRRVMKRRENSLLKALSDRLNLGKLGRL